MTWLNVLDHEKNQKKLDISITKLTCNGVAYNVSKSATPTGLLDSGEWPFLIINKHVIHGTDFVVLSNFTSSGKTINVFNSATFDIVNYIYLIEYSIGIHGHSANENVQASVRFVESTLLSTSLFTAPARATTFAVTPTNNTAGVNFYTSSTVQNYTADLTGAEPTKGIFLLRTSSTPALSTYSALSVRASLISSSSSSPNATLNNIEITIKRIPIT